MSEEKKPSKMVEMLGQQGVLPQIEKTLNPEKPKCKLVGEDGNVFNLIGIVSKTLKRAGQPEKAEEFVEKAFGCSSYSEALRLMEEYVEVS